MVGVAGISLSLTLELISMADLLEGTIAPNLARLILRARRSLLYPGDTLDHNMMMTKMDDAGGLKGL